MTQSILLVLATMLATWFVMRWVRLGPGPAKLQSPEDREIGRARDVGKRLDGARDRASVIEEERNKLALAKAVKAALWVTESRLNVAVPELLKTAQLWVGQARAEGKEWTAPPGVTEVEGLDDVKSPWAAWKFKDQNWRVEGQWRPSILPEEIAEDIGTCKVFLDSEVVLDMTVSSKDLQVMWIDALTVGPWVSDLLTFAGAQRSSATALTSARSRRENQDRADNIHWS